MLDKKLTDAEKAELFLQLFDYHYINILKDEDTDEEVFILYDESGNEYEGEFEFVTLHDFFTYTMEKGIGIGRRELQYDIKKLLNL